MADDLICRTDQSKFTLIEVIESGHNGLENAHSIANKTNNVVRIYSGSNAFRNFNWITGAVGLNKSGDLRGMVISKSSRLIYNYAIKSGKYLDMAGNALFIAGVGLEISKQWSSVHSASGTFDLQKAMLVPSLAILKVFGGVVATSAHVAAWGVKQGCNLSNCSGESRQLIQDVDYTIETSYQEMFDANKVATYINTNLVWK